ncbi:hypothetical protein JNK62_04320 [bacterium]|nr:hypothetical protein [bacterium]
MFTRIRNLWKRLEDYRNTPRTIGSEYTSHILGVSGNLWTVELCRDGVPYRRMQVHSISNLLRRYE